MTSSDEVVSKTRVLGNQLFAAFCFALNFEIAKKMLLKKIILLPAQKWLGETRTRAFGNFVPDVLAVDL